MRMGNAVVVVVWDSSIGTHVEGSEGVPASHALKHEPPNIRPVEGGEAEMGRGEQMMKGMLKCQELQPAYTMRQTML